MVHKIPNFASFDPKLWYNVSQMNKVNLRYVLRVVFCVFVVFWVACRWRPDRRRKEGTRHAALSAGRSKKWSIITAVIKFELMTKRRNWPLPSPPAQKYFTVILHWAQKIFKLSDVREKEKLTSEQELCLWAADAGHNFFVWGEAGTVRWGRWHGSILSLRH